jgi:hypothetical protein
MDIKRTGAERDHGATTIYGDLPLNGRRVYVNWDRDARQLIIRLPAVKTAPKTQHRYYIHLTLDDITTLIDTIDRDVVGSDANLLHDHLREHLPAIVRLLACATGLATVPLGKEPEAEPT